MRLIDKSNVVIAGENFDLTPEDVIALCPKPPSLSIFARRRYGDSLSYSALGTRVWEIGWTVTVTPGQPAGSIGR
jgi:hypothetical protein